MLIYQLIDLKLAEKVIAENKLYKELLEKRKGAKDQYTARGAQTFNPLHINKRVQAEPLPVREVGVQATTWDIYDTMEGGDNKRGHETKEMEEKDDHVLHQISRASVGGGGGGGGGSSGAGGSRTGVEDLSPTGSATSSHSHTPLTGRSAAHLSTQFSSHMSSPSMSASFHSSASGAERPSSMMSGTLFQPASPYERIAATPAFVKSLQIVGKI
jgi:hypothetical protein